MSETAIIYSVFIVCFVTFAWFATRDLDKSIGYRMSAAMHGSTLSVSCDSVGRDGRVYRGNAASGFPAYTRVGDQIYLGNAASGRPSFTVVGDRVYYGNDASGVPALTIHGGAVYAKNNVSGIPLGTLHGNRIYKGNDVSGIPLATTLAEDPVLLAVIAL